MTDFEKLRELLDGWGVKYEARKWQGEDKVTYLLIDVDGERQYDIGFCCFWTEFRFTHLEGKFVGMGAWE